jgi:hypothetical protein
LVAANGLVGVRRAGARELALRFGQFPEEVRMPKARERFRRMIVPSSPKFRLDITVSSRLSGTSTLIMLPS